MTSERPEDPAAARAGPETVEHGGALAPDPGVELDARQRRLIARELDRNAETLAAIGPPDPDVEPGVDLRRRLVRAARA